MKKFLLIFILIIQFTGLEAQLNINHYIRVGRTRIQIGNYVGAIEYFNIVIKFKPYLPEPFFYRGVAKSQLEDFRGAIRDYDKAIEIKPYYPEAYMYRGMAYHELQNFGEAIKNYNRAIELDPTNEGVFNNRGIAKMSQKDVEGAIADYKKSLELNPKSTTSLMNMSNAKIIKGDTKGAIQDLNQVIVIRPQYAAAYLNRGLARFELNDYASALRDYDQCIRFDSQNALAFNNRGIVKHKLEDLEGAIMDYDMAIRLSPDMASAYFNRAMAKEVLKRPGFEKDYEIAAQLNPQYDLNKRTVDGDALAQKSQQQTRQQQGKQPPAGKQQNTSSGQPSAGTQQPATNNQPVTLASDTLKKEDEAAKQKKDELERIEQLKRRMRANLVVEDNRHLPGEKKEKIEDGRIQNQDIIIDIQPVFVISAFRQNSVDYDRLQYYDQTIESLNKENNYDPLLTVNNKNNDEYRELYQNYVLYFNDRIKIKETSNYYLTRGIFYLLTGEYNKSMADLDKAVGLDSKNSLAYFTRGNCRLKMVEKIESLTDNTSKIVIKSREKKPLNKTTPDNQTVLIDYSQVLEDYQKTVELNPGFFLGYYNCAYIYLKQKNHAMAIANLNKAIELESDFAEGYFNRGLTKLFLFDVEGAAVDLSKAGELGLQDAYNIIKRYCN
jgi:tetratricopeptide (TPR) repeat protein